MRFHRALSAQFSTHTVSNLNSTLVVPTEPSSDNRRSQRYVQSPIGTLRCSSACATRLQLRRRTRDACPRQFADRADQPSFTLLYARCLPTLEAILTLPNINDYTVTPSVLHAEHILVPDHLKVHWFDGFEKTAPL
jgi:hypothetical protein